MQMRAAVEMRMKRPKGLISMILIYTLEQAHWVSKIEREGFKPVNSERRIWFVITYCTGDSSSCRSI